MAVHLSFCNFFVSICTGYLYGFKKKRRLFAGRRLLNFFQHFCEYGHSTLHDMSLDICCVCLTGGLTVILPSAVFTVAFAFPLVRAGGYFFFAFVFSHYKSFLDSFKSIFLSWCAYIGLLYAFNVARPCVSSIFRIVPMHRNVFPSLVFLG